MPIKKIMFRNCALFTNCISKVNNTQVDNAHDIDVVMPMYNLIEYSDTYSKSSESLWQYYITILLIFRLIIIVFCSNLNKK